MRDTAIMGWLARCILAPTMKATDLIEKQHRVVETLFAQFEKAKGDSEKKKTFEKIAANLVAHDAIEREILYPAIERALGKDEDILQESLVEHGVVEFCLFRADQHTSSEELEAYVKVLKEVVEHHVEEEEEELVPKVEKAIGADQLEVMGAKMEARFEQAMREGFRGPLRDNLEQVLAGRTRTVKRAKAAAARSVSRAKAPPKRRRAKAGSRKRAGSRARASR